MSVLDLFLEDFHPSTITTADELVFAYGHRYSESYLRTVLANSEILSEYSPTYRKRTVRLSPGVYEIL